MAPPSPRSVFGRLLVLFLVVPVLDLALLVWIGGRIGFWPTLALIVLTALAGSALAQREGLRVLARFQARLAGGQMPGRELTDGLIVLASGLLLLTPGVLTDAAGLLGLFPPTRALVRRALRGQIRRGLAAGSLRTSAWPPPPASPEEDVIDVAFEEVVDEER